jgi:hypothetical protein
MGGLAVATLLTLVFLPALYVAWFRIRMPRGEASPEVASDSVSPAPASATGRRPMPARLLAALRAKVRRAQRLLTAQHVAKLRRF